MTWSRGTQTPWRATTTGHVPLPLFPALGGGGAGVRVAVPGCRRAAELSTAVEKGSEISGEGMKAHQETTNGFWPPRSSAMQAGECHLAMYNWFLRFPDFGFHVLCTVNPWPPRRTCPEGPAALRTRMRQLHAGVPCGLKSELATDLPCFGPNCSQNPHGRSGRRRVSAGGGRLGAAPLPAAPRPTEVRTGTGAEECHSLEWVHSKLPRFPPPPPFPCLSLLYRRFTAHKGATCHCNWRPSSKARGKKRESSSACSPSEVPSAAAAAKRSGPSAARLRPADPLL